jgi:hypothetical protein
MKLQQLHQTVFSVEPMKNIVGVGGTAAYQIEVRQGSALGTVGPVSVPAQAEICNDPIFSAHSANTSGTGRAGAWLRSALATLKI